ncbi:MAG: hypothetical protein KDK40_01665, partial [Chlamydiia bacterium]|nr:hypothetical protein [Chlamydiia bacterium]
ERYEGHPALLRWQVENEPFFPFGECPKREKGFYNGEVALVRTLDPNHDTQVTTSGEQSLWVLYADGADVVGSSLYRTVYVPVLGYFTFPIPSFVYTFQAQLVELFGKRVVISELQMEPWLPPNNDELSIDERAVLFTPENMQRNARYAEKTRISEVYVWGIEWWYYLHLNQHSDLWNAGKDLFITEGYENI